MALDRLKAYLRLSLVLLVLYPTGLLAIRTPQCFVNVVSCAEDSTSPNCTSTLNISSATALSVLRTSDGSLIPNVLDSIEAATALSYAGCVEYCADTVQQFHWADFAQEYSTWLLPYLSLLSQLPFGARRRMDNLMSVVLTLGSPVLAGYSLYLTFLNARWVNDHLFSSIHYPNTAVRQSVVRVLSGLQQVPLRVHPGEDALFESLVVHPDNDDWWCTFAEELQYSQTWSIASAVSICWVVIAYLLTVASSIANLVQSDSNGDASSSAWLWLLPIVVGWLILSPKCDQKRVVDAYKKANRTAFVMDSNSPRAAPTRSGSVFGLTITHKSDWAPRTNTISPDESRIPPIFNYARVWLWAQNVYVTSLFYRAASEQSNRRVGVDNNPIPRSMQDGVPRESRLGSRNEIIQYCRPDSHGSSRSSVLWPRGIIYNMVVASLMALQLQWGATGAAVLGIWFTPTIGLGCRSVAYLLNAALSTAVWFLLVVSSILGYYSHYLLSGPPISEVGSNRRQPYFTTSPRSDSTTALTENSPGLLGQPPPAEINAVPMREIRGTANAIPNGAQNVAPNIPDAVRFRARTLARLADWLRWTGKTIAIINAIGSIANSLFDYAKVYDNCFCDSSVFNWGQRAFAVLAPSQSDIRLEVNGLIGALALVLSSCAVFIGSIYLIRDSVPL